MKMFCSHWLNKELTGHWIDRTIIGRKGRLKESWKEEGQGCQLDAEEARRVEDEITSHESCGSM